MAAASNAALRVRYLAPAEITPAPRNARTHSPAQVQQIARSIGEYGWTNPCLIDEDGRLIAGHGRLEAAQSLGLDKVPTITLAGLSDAQKRALALADNRLALSAGWDEDTLRLELGELGLAGYDLSLIGFSDDEMAAILAEPMAGLTDPDDAPEPPAEPVSRLGDVWLLGRHRLVCGDATSEVDVSLCIGAVRPHLMVTDPPYGVDYDPAWREEAAKKGLIGFSPSALGAVTNDGKIDWRDAWLLFPGDVAYCWHAPTFCPQAQASIEAVGFDIRSQIVWAKSSFAISRGHYNWQHEACCYAVRKGKTGHWCGSKSASTLWEIPHVKNETGHSTQKPVECMKRPIENNSSPGQAVYDPFVGSFTTGIAAEMTGRCLYALEISPAYIDVGIIRWQNFVGAEATLEETGETFAAMTVRRHSVSASEPVAESIDAL